MITTIILLLQLFCGPKCANAVAWLHKCAQFATFTFLPEVLQKGLNWQLLFTATLFLNLLVPTFLGVVIVAPLIFSLSLFTSFSPFFAPFSPFLAFFPFSSLPAPPSPPLSESSPSFDSSLVEGSVDRRMEVLEPKANFFGPFPLRSSSLESWKQKTALRVTKNHSGTSTSLFKSNIEHRIMRAFAQKLVCRFCFCCFRKSGKIVRGVGWL